MRKSASISLAAISAFFFWAGTTTAQYIISSKAGFVNRVDGKVYVIRQDTVEGETKASAILGTQMEDGERLSTDAKSYAELLLNPGSYLRLNEKSELRAVNTDLARIRFELISGSAIVETGEVDKKEPIEIITPNGSFFIRKTGLQRIDITDSLTSVAVRQGAIELGTLEEVLANKSRNIGRGKIARLNGDPVPTLAKIEKNAEVDEFDSWSFNRAELLMAANQRALRSLDKGNLAYGWYYDPFLSFYTFVPRGSYWSPYGFGFFNSFNGCIDCYFPPVGYGYGYMGGGSGRNTNGNNGNGFNGRPGPPPRVVCGIDHGPVRNLIQGLVRDNGWAAYRPPSGGSFSPASSGGSTSPGSSPSTPRTGNQHPGNGGWHGGGSHSGGGVSHTSGGGGFHGGGGGGGASHSGGGGGGSHGGGKSN
ncbi:MAG: FecR domain-containing protein [Blastocatellia bacterium]|nr:FecR domain-containing protein [Blastocatellia bacterium]